MTHMTITIDGKVLLRGDLDKRKKMPPSLQQYLQQYAKPGAKREPWVPALMAAIMDATVTSTPTTVTVKTHTTGWTVAVDTAA
jgi:hypothetical protein